MDCKVKINLGWLVEISNGNLKTSEVFSRDVYPMLLIRWA